MKERTRQIYPYMSILFDSKAMLHLLGIVIGFALLITLLLGFAFLFVFQGLVFATLHLSPYSRTAYRFASILANVRPDEGAFESLPLPWWRVPIVFIRLAIYLILTGSGIWLLLHIGFCDQNLICLVVTHR